MVSIDVSVKKANFFLENFISLSLISVRFTSFLHRMIQVQVLILLCSLSQCPQHRLHTCLNLFLMRHTLLVPSICFFFCSKVPSFPFQTFFLRSTFHIWLSLPLEASFTLSFLCSLFFCEWWLFARIYAPFRNFLKFLLISAKSSSSIYDSSFLLALSPRFFYLFPSLFLSTFISYVLRFPTSSSRDILVKSLAYLIALTFISYDLGKVLNTLSTCSVVLPKDIN